MPDMPNPDHRPKPSQDRQLEQENFLADAEIISVYTRAQALEDGALVDVSELAKKAGFLCPVAVTAAIWADIENIPEEDKNTQDTTGRLWRVLCMAVMRIRRSVAQGGLGRYERLQYYVSLTLPNNGYSREIIYEVKMVVDFDDDGADAITIMKPNQY